MEEERVVNPDDYKGKLPVYMRQGIPPYLQILFAARPQLPFVEPVKKPYKIKLRGFFDDKEQLDRLRALSDQKRQERLELIKDVEMKEKYKNIKSPEEKEENWKNRMEKHIKNKKTEYKQWLASERFNNKNKTGNAFQTLIVYNLSYRVEEEKLKSKLKEFGEIVSCKIIKDQNGKSKGYAFVEYETMKDFLRAYNKAHNMKIDGRRIGVDAEFGRTNEKFRPLRLGGGLSKKRKTQKTPYQR